MQELWKAPEPNEADEDDMFGQIIASNLKKLPPQQKAFAKLKMLYDLQFGLTSDGQVYFPQENMYMYAVYSMLHHSWNHRTAVYTQAQ